MGRRVAGWKDSSDAFVDALFLGSANLLFGQPIVELRARLVASLDVEFVGSAPDAFFKRSLSIEASFAWAGGGMGSPPAITVSQMVSDQSDQIRGVSAHNAVVVDADSSRVWGGEIGAWSR